MMSSNNYLANIRNENQSYPFNNVSPFYPQNTTTTPTSTAASEQQATSSCTPGRVINIGLSGPGSHLEETTPSGPPPAPIGVKSSGRGRRKQRKKNHPYPDNLIVETLKMENMEEASQKNLNEGVPMPVIEDGIPDLLYKPDGMLEEQPSYDNNQLLLNSNTLDQILSYKKMMLIQSPDVVEFLRKQLASSEDRK